MRQQCHNSKLVTFQEKPLKFLKCYNFLSATTTQLPSSGQFCKLRYDTIPLKVHLQTFLSIPVTQKCQILSCDTLVANERYVLLDDGPFRPKHVARKFRISIMNILSCGRRCLFLYYCIIFIIIITINTITTVGIKSRSQIFFDGFSRCVFVSFARSATHSSAGNISRNSASVFSFRAMTLLRR